MLRRSTRRADQRTSLESVGHMMSTTQDSMTLSGADEAPVTFVVSPQIVAVSDPNGVETESISALRTHLLAKHVRDGKRGLTICAADERDGAVSLGVNLAVSFAQAGIRTLLMDCDLRSPRVHHFIRPSVMLPGLRDLLEQETLNVGAAIQSEALPNLSIMYAGGASQTAQELIFSNRFAQALDLCLRDFEATIVVPPPSKTYADARRIAGLMRYAIIVARRNVTLLADVKALANELNSDGVRVIGTVFNAS